MKRTIISIAVSVLLILFSACNPGMKEPADIKGSLSTKDFDVFMEEHQTAEELATFFDKYPKAPEYMKDDIRKAIIKKLDNRSYDTILLIQSKMRDSQVVSNIDTLLWGHEEYAWRLAIENYDLSFCEKYIEMYPDGEHVKQIQDQKQVLINEEKSYLMNVAIYKYYGGAVEVWEPDFSDPSSPTSSIVLENDDTASCTVYLRNKSGKVQTITLKSHATCEKTIANGAYDLVVIDDNENITPWACRLNAKGSYYNLRLYTYTQKKENKGLSEFMQKKLQRL